MNPSSEDLIRYRLQRAEETLDQAILMIENDYLDACVNRLYYACFYAVNALLISHNLSSSKHSGVKSLFNQHFVKTGLVPKDLGALFTELFINRQVGDYQDLILFDAQTVQTWLANVRIFIQQIQALVKKHEE